jgi:hypothetical protein
LKGGVEWLVPKLARGPRARHTRARAGLVDERADQRVRQRERDRLESGSAV